MMKHIPGLQKALENQTRQIAGIAFAQISASAEQEYRRLVRNFYEAWRPRPDGALQSSQNLFTRFLPDGNSLVISSQAGDAAVPPAASPPDPRSFEHVFSQWLRIFLTSRGSGSAWGILSRTCKHIQSQTKGS